MSKPNLLYYFRTKGGDARALIDRVLDTWLDPLREFDADGKPRSRSRAISAASWKWPATSRARDRLFANEILRARP